MTNKEIRLRCTELALEYLSKDSLRNMELDHIFETAEKIYEFVRKDNDAIGENDEVNWEAYKKKLLENNRKIRIKM